MKISIIGTGIYSIALALSLKSTIEIKMWSENQELVNHFEKKHNLKPLTDEFIPNNINIYNDMKTALEDTDLIILGTSAKYIRSVCQNMKLYFNKTTPICIASKGIENDTCKFLSDIVIEELKAKNIAVISGPTFAKDLINKEISALTLASSNNKTAKIISNAFNPNILKSQVTNDIYGTELLGSIKNVIAIASGILDGLKVSESTKAFLLTEAANDIKELLIKLECNPNTILSYAGIGDLILTCTSPSSRNFLYGQKIGLQKNSDEFLKNNTVEGYYTLLSIKQLTKNRKIKMPLINVIYDIVIKKENPHNLLDFLLS